MLDAIYKKAFSAEAWRGKTAGRAFTTMCRMLKEMEQFMTVRKAVRQMDIGHLRRAVDHLIIPFLRAS